ncbi:MAG TPA: response regulator [Thermoanaerobaculia bacterium]|jgi:two-component system chemotaxis response regulator CheY|nr:response regulator [Thermoanaerobaculia bacterium]
MQPKKALVIDDSTLIHKMFKLMLPHSTVVCASDGREALHKLAAEPDVELIFLDINMPNMNGLEFLVQVKADTALAQIPVIIVSTEGKEEDTIRGLRAGAAAYVKKPFRNEALQDLIRKVMEHGAGASTAERVVG